MHDFFTVLLAVAPVFLVIGFGIGFRKTRVLLPEWDTSILRLIVYLLTPCLILHSILGNTAVKEPANIALAPISGFFFVAIGIGVSFLVAWIFRFPRLTRRTFAYAAGVQNYGYIAIPVAQILFPIETMGILFLFMMGAEAAVWVFAPTVLGSGNLKSGLKRIINPPLVSVVLGLLLNTIGADRYIPEFFNVTFSMLGQCSIPMGLLLSGAMIFDLTHAFYRPGERRILVFSVVVRMGVLPALFIFATVLLPISDELKQIIIIQSAMPASMFSLVLCKLYNGHAETALRIVVSTTFVGIIGIPFWVQIGLKILGN